MRYYSAAITGILYLFLLVLLSACAGVPAQWPESEPANENSAAVPEKPVVERPQPPVEIMGKGMVAEEKLALFLMTNNAKADPVFAKSLAGIYIKEAADEGVNHDIAFAQMCLETGSLRYGGLVTPDMNNFCGLGSTGAPGTDGRPEKGNIFPDPRTGVRAHIQHLKAYATNEPLNNDLVDPRYSYVKLGISPTINGLAGRWAADPYYSRKIAALLKQLYESSFRD
jgi:hypothetical protein